MKTVRHNFKNNDYYKKIFSTKGMLPYHAHMNFMPRISML